MKYLDKPFIKVGLLTFLFLVTIFSRPFVGIYLFQFRIGELVVAVSFIMFLFFISKRQNFENKYQILINLTFFLLLSFVISNYLEDGFFLSTYLFKSSSYIWTVSFLFVGYKLQLYNQNFAYLMSFGVILLYVFNTILYPSIFIEFFQNFSDKFELSKAASMMISVVFVNTINFYFLKDKKQFKYFFIFSNALFLPLLLFNSRGSFISLVLFILLFIFFDREILFSNFKSSIILIFIFVLTFLGSTYNIFGELDFSKRAQSEQIEISSVSDNLNKLVENKNTIDVFMSFFIYEGRIYSRDGTTDWRLDIWQDVVEDLRDKNKLLFGYGYSSIIPVMVDPEAPGRLGEDGLNENVHNYAITILARGGLIQLILFAFFHLKIINIFKRKNDSLFILVILIPLFFNAFLDVAMESVQYPFIFYMLVGFLLSSKKDLNNNLQNNKL